mmetsp:Transcript_53833/g.61150  ORF Transcript_53833/g.61150 Transcript_53833/m.61150 type:complete len:187 (-) Transcript_53833:254-814(-)
MLAAAPPPGTILLNKPEDVGIMSAPSGCATSSGGLFEDVNNLLFCGSSSTLCTSGPIDVNNEYDMHDVTSAPRGGVTGGHLRNNHVHFDRDVHFGDDKADHECHYKAFLKKEDHNSKSSHHHHRGTSESRRLQQKSKGYSHHYQEPTATAVSTHSMNGHNTHRRNNTAEEQIFSPFNDMDGLYVFH